MGLFQNLTASIVIGAALFGGLRAPALFAADVSPNTSDFELFLEKLDGKIPFPPQKMLERLAKRNTTSIPIVTELFPKGRSLERKDTDFSQPRAVMAWAPRQDQQQPVFFFAYTPKKKQLEIISYNWKTGQNEFRVVSNYGPGMKPKVEMPPQGACRACHQGGNAIFPVNPWSESSFEPAVAERLRKSVTDPFASYLLKSYEADLKSSGPRIVRSAEDFDNRVNLSNAEVESRQFCPELCGGDLDCRETLFGVMAFAQRGRGWSELEVFSAVTPETRIPNIGRFAFRNNSLQDRDPGELEHDAGAEQDPLLPRKRQDPDEFPWRLHDMVRSCSPRISAADRKRMERFTPDELKAALRSSEARLFLSKNWLPELSWSRAIDLLERVKIRREPSAKGAYGDCATRLGEAQPISEATGTLLGSLKTEISKSMPMAPNALAIRYCASCHYGDGSIAPTLPLLDLSRMKRYLGSTVQRTPALLLENKIMPPEGELQPSEDERKLLIDAIRSAK